MKNTILVLSAIFLMLSSTISNGQHFVNTSNPSISDLSQVLPPEFEGLIKQVIKEANLAINNLGAIQGINDIDGAPFAISIELTVEMESIDPTQLHIKQGSPNQLVGLNYPIQLNDRPARRLSRTISPERNLSLILRYLKDENNLQQLVNASCQSVVCTDQNTDPVELGDENWMENEKIPQLNPVSSFGDWEFNIGPNQYSL